MKNLIKGLILVAVLVAVTQGGSTKYKSKVRAIDWARVSTQR